jgi:hypothetical protein
MTPQPLNGKLRHLARTVRALMALRAGEHGLYVETGAHSGRSMTAILSHLLTQCGQIRAEGYDLFEQASDTTHDNEHNGKGTGKSAKCASKLLALQAQAPGLSFQLYQGFTTHTLQDRVADWAYIDGGHSTDTVAWDHARLEHSRVIVFDDADLAGVNRYLWTVRSHPHIYDLEPMDGCRQVVIVNDPDHYDFEHANLKPLAAVDPDRYIAPR